MKAATPEMCDVAIVGGGLVGCSLAVALAGADRRVALIEAAPERESSPAWDERCIALNAGSRQILEQIGAWDALSGLAEPITSTHISEKGRFGATRFSAEEAGLAALGYNTPVRAIDAALWRHVADAGIGILRPARLASLRTAPDHVRLGLEGGRELVAKLVVAADGARSALRDLLGVSARSRDYQQVALVTAVRPQHAHHGVAYERFLQSGPLAILPKPDDAGGHACSLVWTLPTAEAERRVAVPDSLFLEEAQAAFGERLGHFRELGRRQSYPLHQVLAEQAVAARTVFIGNAAQSLHPVAAQGFNLGLRDAATLAALLTQASDPGEAAVLEAFARHRETDRRRTADFTDQLVRLFSNRLPGLHQLRHLGLLALELDSPLRRSVMQQNLGLAPSARTGSLA